MLIDTLDRALFYLEARERQAIIWPTMLGAAQSGPKVFCYIILVLRTSRCGSHEKKKERKRKKQSLRLTYQIVRGILKGKKGNSPLKPRPVLHFEGYLSSKGILGLYDTLLSYRMV